MDEFFRDQFHGLGDIFWLDNEALPVNQSAFVAYANRPRSEFPSQNAGDGSNSLSANKRMIEFLRKIQPAKMEPPEHDGERGHRHMINERMRREREKQNYLALHSMMPPGTKNDKNSIVKTAAKRIHELQCCKQELERKNYELESNLGLKNEGTKISVNVNNPTSGVDSMLEVLKCLKNLGSSTRSIQAEFSDHKLTAVLGIETQMGAGVVEKAVQRALQQAEDELLFRYYQEG